MPNNFHDKLSTVMHEQYNFGVCGSSMHVSENSHFLINNIIMKVTALCYFIWCNVKVFI